MTGSQRRDSPPRGRFPAPPPRVARASALACAAVTFALFVADSSFASDPPDTMTATGYRWPVDVSRTITSTFGELRPDRFHAALDFSINGDVGAPCFAIADGHVSRVRANFTGYGRALYLTLADGTTAVYAHLHEFTEPVERRLRAEQLRQGTFEVEMWLDPGELEFNQGDVVGYCGGSGSGAPHLHFELRTPDNVPFNPILAGFRYDDTRAPYVRRFAIRPLDGDSEAGGEVSEIVRNITDQTAEPVQFYGRAGLSVEVRDFQDGGWYRLGPTRIEFFLDDSLRHRTVLDTFPYALNHQSRLEFDYELGRNNGYRRFRRLYVAPGNELGFYDDTLPGGIIDTRELAAGTHTARVVVTDAAGNTGEATWPLEALAAPTVPPASEPDTLPALLNAPHAWFDQPFEFEFIGRTVVVRVPDVSDFLAIEQAWTASPAYRHPKRLVRRADGSWFARSELDMDYHGPAVFSVLMQDTSGAVFEARRERIVFPLPAGRSVLWSLPEHGFSARFDGSDLPWDMVAAFSPAEPDSGTIAPLYTLEPRDYPFLDTFEMTLARDGAPWDANAVMVYRERPDHDWLFLSNQRAREGLALEAKVFSFETFSVARDTVPPLIERATPADGAVFASRRPRLAVTVTDEFSGLDTDRCALLLDGNEVIWEYDPDADRLFYIPWEPIADGEHSWTVTATDRAGNRSELTREFVVD